VLPSFQDVVNPSIDNQPLFKDNTRSQPIQNAAHGKKQRNSVARMDDAVFNSGSVSTISGQEMNPYVSPNNGDRQTTLKPATLGATFSLGVAIPAFIALVVSVYLAYTSLTSSTVAGCAGTLFDCGSVLNSKWSRWLGLPVSLLASATYVGLLGSLGLAQSGSSRRRDLMWMIVAICSLSAGGAALWFIYLQLFVLEHLCAYCLVAHGCGLILATTFLIVRPWDFSTLFRLGTVAMAGLCCLVVGQSIGPAPATFKIEEFPPQAVNTPVAPHPETSGSYLQPNSRNEDNQDVGPLNESPAGESGLNEEMIFEAPDIFEAPSVDFSDKQTRSSFSPNSHWESLSLSSLAFSALSLNSVVVYQPLPAKAKPQGATQENQSETAEPQTNNKNAEPAQQAEQKSGQATAPAPVRRLAVISGGSVRLDLKQWPLVGDCDAKYAFVEMFDYSCPHCRKTHQNSVKGAKEKMGTELAVMVLPLPLNTKCNDAIVSTGTHFGESCELAKLAISVWLVDREKFSAFHNWMFTGEHAPNYATAKAQAETLVDAEKLAATFNSKLPDSYIAKHVQIYKMIGKGNVPKLMFPTTSVVGEFGSSDALVDLIRKQGPIAE
jgi:uncharacterized membrane protein/protein-disulfide isomerase